MADKTLFTADLADVDKAVPSGMTLGDIRREDGRVYKYVKYDPGADEDLVANELVLYKDASNTDVTGDIADVATPRLAGIAVAAVDLGVQGSGNVAHMWVQIEGQATLLSAITGSADGDPLTLSATSKALRIQSAVTAPVIASGIDVSAFIVSLKCSR